MSRQKLVEEFDRVSVSVINSVDESHLNTVLNGLESMWGNEEKPSVLAFEEPLDGLMLTILSQNTNDRNRDRAFDNLRSQVPSWEQMSGMESSKVADLIRVAGIANIKAARMLEVLAIVKKSTGSFSLKQLLTWPEDKAREFLVNLPGVGPKTAACVLVFDMGIPAFPVDTHVARFCRRMGWVPEKMSPDRIQGEMENLVPDERKKGAHLNIISHGKNICKSRKDRKSVV